MRLILWLVLVVAVGACERPPPPACDDDGGEKQAKPVPSGMPLGPITLVSWGANGAYRYTIDERTLLSAFALGERSELPLEALPNGSQRVLAAAPGSLFEQGGLRVGDEITAIAGTELSGDWLTAAERSWREHRKIEMTIERNGDPLKLTYTLEQPPPPESSSATPRSGKEVTIVIPRAKAKSLLNNQAKVTRSFRIVPHQRDGKVVGLKIYGIKAGSAPADLGLKNGDVILKVAGFDVSSPERALEAYAKVRDSDEVRLELERDGEPLTLIYRVTP